MIKYLKPIAAAAAASLALNSTANAFDFFLEIPNIQGDVTDADFKGAIQVLAWSWGISQSGGGVGASAQDISITKYVDSSSVDLIMNSAAGVNSSTATFSARKDNTTFVQIEIVMEGFYVSAVSTGGSGGETQLTENISLNFDKITTRYFAFDGATPDEFCFDTVIKAECL